MTRGPAGCGEARAARRRGPWRLRARRMLQGQGPGGEQYCQGSTLWQYWRAGGGGGAAVRSVTRSAGVAYWRGGAHGQLALARGRGQAALRSVPRSAGMAVPAARYRTTALACRWEPDGADHETKPCASGGDPQPPKAAPPYNCCLRRLVGLNPMADARIHLVGLNLITDALIHLVMG